MIGEIESISTLVDKMQYQLEDSFDAKFYIGLDKNKIYLCGY